jgi:hypothetical protein
MGDQPSRTIRVDDEVHRHIRFAQNVLLQDGEPATTADATLLLLAVAAIGAAIRESYTCDACNRIHPGVPARRHDGPHGGPVCPRCWAAFREDNGDYE